MTVEFVRYKNYVLTEISHSSTLNPLESTQEERSLVVWTGASTDKDLRVGLPEYLQVV